MIKIYQNWKEIVMLSYKSIWLYKRGKRALLFNTFVGVCNEWWRQWQLRLKKVPWKTFHNKFFSVTYVKQYRYISCRTFPDRRIDWTSTNRAYLFTHKKCIKIHSTRAEPKQNNNRKKRDNFKSCCHWIVTIIAFKLLLLLLLLLCASYAMHSIFTPIDRVWGCEDHIISMWKKQKQWTSI